MEEIDNILEQKMSNLDEQLRKVQWPFSHCVVDVTVRNYKPGKADIKITRKLD